MASMLRDHGMSKSKRYWHDAVGYNYRLTNLQAAIGVAQFERLSEFVNTKRSIAKKYNEVFSSTSYIDKPLEAENTINSYWLYTCLVKNSAPFNRDQIMNFLNQNGIETRPVFFPMHSMPPYVKYGNVNNLENSIYISKHGFSLPSSVSLSELEINFICDKISLFLKSYQRN